jgi:hypothetical protein
MSDFNTGPRRRWIDQLADAGKPATANGNVGERSVWWWILLMPGKVILWLEYMFPERLASVFGTARRRNVPLIQLLYSLYFYAALVGLIFLLLIEASGKR